MEDKKLFDVYERTRLIQSGHREATYKFLNESAWNWVEYVRSVCETWYSDFPFDKEFHSNFLSKNESQHASAFFELYMHALFRRMGFEVEYNRMIGTRKIDLTLSCNGETILTDCVLSGEPNLDRAIDSIEKQIQDLVEEIESNDYCVGLRFLRTSRETPRLSSLIKCIEEELERARVAKSELEEFKWEDKKWIVGIRLRRKSPSVGRTLGSVLPSQRGGFVDGPSMDVLRRTLDSKRGSSYNVKHPYIISVNTANFSLYRELIRGTLYGEMNIEGYSNHLVLKDAFFYLQRPQNTSVSAILFVKRLSCGGIGNAVMELWKNPWAKYPLTSELLTIDEFSPKLNSSNTIEKIDFSSGMKANEILGIRENILVDDQ